MFDNRQTETNNSYMGLRFDARGRSVPYRLITVLIAAILFSLLWRFVPHNALYWLLLPLIAVLVWMASYAWRTALNALISLLSRLENL